MANTLLLNKVLASKACHTTIIKEFQDEHTLLHVPSVYSLGKPTKPDFNNISKKNPTTPCRFFKEHRKKRNCIQYCIDTATKLEDKLNLALYTPTFDNTILRCSNPFCCSAAKADTTFASGNTFHASCYAYLIYQDKNKFHITKHEYFHDAPLKIRKTIVFPVCQGKCWNRVFGLCNAYYTSLPPNQKRMHRFREGVEKGDQKLIP